jgi:predicted  nucleic acid-binding Zn-ribbon protein
LDKGLVEVAANEVKKILCLSPDGREMRYSFERPEKGKDLEPRNLPIDRKIDKSALNRLAGALSSLRMDDVLNPSSTAESIGMEISALFEYHLFNGMIYRVYPGKASSDDDGGYLKIEAEYKKPSEKKGETPEEVSSEKEETSEVSSEKEETSEASSEKEETSEASSEKEETSAEKSPGEYALEVKKLNERLSSWIYVISKWQHGAFETDLDQLLEKPDKEKQGS